MNNADIIIVGAGISGCTLAERYANLGKRVFIIEKRNHIGGNCFDHENEIGIRVNKYGPHYFRTNDKVVWDYVRPFSEWVPFKAVCLSNVDGKKVPIPVNIETVNMLFGENITNENEMKKWLSGETEKIESPKNSEEAALKIVGRRIYEKMFKNYTQKQWDKDPIELHPSVMERIPVRFDFENRYFTDSYQFYPAHGYTTLFENIIIHKNISVMMNTDWHKIKDQIGSYEKLFFSGRIDSYFDEALGKLEYRSLRFEEENLERPFFQDVVQENYPEAKTPFTRIVEYKHQSKQVNPRTTIVREYPTWSGEPYYPVPTEENRKIYERYQKKAQALERENVYFVGRLANYKYFNMDQAFKNALDLFNRLESKKPHAQD